MKIGIMGVGVVGGVTAQVFKKVHKIFLWDKYKENCNSPTNLEELARESEVVFICVPTPMKKSGAIDYAAIYDSAEKLEEEVKRIGINPQDTLVTIRSTAVSGTTDELAEKYPFFRFAFNPEFLTEKNALWDMEKTNRIVLGVEDELSERQLLEVYKPLFPNAKYTVANRKTAEMIKYAANVLLTLQIAGANEIYQICERAGIDYGTVRTTIQQDERIGRNIQVPGPDGDFGFGGKCFPKDLRALTYLARELGYEPGLLQAAWELNLRVRKNKDWDGIPGAVSGNNRFGEQTKLAM